MGTRGRETQDMGNTGLTLLPPPERCIPHHAPCTIHHPMGRGGGRSGGLKEHRDRTGGLQGGARSGTHGGAGSSGGHGRGGDSGSRGGTAFEAAAPAPTPASLAGALLPPPKNFLGESRGSIGHLGALWMHGHLGALWRRRYS